MSRAPDRGEDLRADQDVPGSIRYDPDLAVHEPMPVPSEPVVPSRRRSPLLLFAAGALLLSVAVYVLFGLIASEGKTAADYLDEIRTGRGRAWQAAFELSRLLPKQDPRRRDPGLAPQIVALFEGARGEDPRLRRYLALVLLELRDRRSVDALLASIGDADLQTRLYVVWALGEIGEARAAGALLPLLGDEEADLRKIAAHALGSMPGPGVGEALRAAINDPVDDVAWNAALSLARLGDRSGVPLLARMLDRGYLAGIRRPDPDGRVRGLSERQMEEAMLGAMRALARLGDRDHLALLRALRDGDPSLQVRQAALETLEALGARDGG
jgi:HEAT repeat protein